MTHLTLVSALSVSLLPILMAGECAADTAPDYYEEIYIKGSNVLPRDEAWKVGMAVLTAADIARIQAASMQELLKNIPGVYVNDSGTGVTSIHLRGAEANYTLVLLDGVPMNDPSDSRGGSFDLNLLDPSLVNTIEILSGSAAALYGSGALGGVINITLKKRSVDGLSLTGDYGTNDSYRVSGAGAVKLGEDVDLSLSASRKDMGDLPTLGRLDATQVMASLGYRISDHTYMRLTSVNIDQSAANFPEDSGGALYAVWRDQDQRAATVGRYSFTLGSELGESLSLNTTASYFKQHKVESSPGVAPGNAIPPNGAVTDLSRYNAELGFTYKVSESWHSYLGAHYAHEAGDSEGYLYAPGVFDLPFSLARDRLSLISENKWALGAQHDLHTTVRLDFPDAFSTQLSLAGSYVWTAPTEESSLRATVMTGYKEPSFFALGHPLTGNPALKLEKSTSMELAWRQKLAIARGASFEAKLFYSRYKNLVDFDEVSFLHVNRDRVEVTGGELSTDIKLGASLEVGGAATYMKGTIMGVDRRLRNRPDWLANVYMNWAVSDDINIYGSVAYVDRQYSSSFVTGPEMLDDFVTVNATINWKINRSLLLYAKVNNATDTHYEEAVGFPAQGTTARIGMTVLISP